MSYLDFLNDFDPNATAEADTGGDFDALPPGWYSARVSEANVQQTKAGNGSFVYLRLDIEGPTHAGRVVFDRMIVAHPNPTAVDIGRKRFAAACLAAGFEKKPNDTGALIGRVVMVKLKTEKSKEYGDKSVPDTYKAAGEGAVSLPVTDDDDVPF